MASQRPVTAIARQLISRLPASTRSSTQSTRLSIAYNVSYPLVRTPTASTASRAFSSQPARQNAAVIDDQQTRIQQAREQQGVGSQSNHNAQGRENIGQKRFADFELAGGVFIVTGGGRGLGLCMAEALVEAGGKVWCLDRLPEPDGAFAEAKSRVNPEFGGELHYRQVNVVNTENLDNVISDIAARYQRLDGLIAAAGVQQLCAATRYTVEDATRIMSINYTGLFMAATACARQMFKYKCKGTMCFIASMSGTVANKGLVSPVYNSSKAAVIQLARNLAMEWGRVQEKDGSGGIRVNCLSPGHIVTPMVEKNFEEVPGLRDVWEKENMLGRLARPEEFKSAGLFLLSRASSFMTGNNLIIDGGHTAW